MYTPRKLKAFRCMLFISIVLMLYGSTAFASGPYYNTFNRHVNSNGVGDWGNDTLYYHVNSSSTLYDAIITKAVNSWNATSTPIYYKKDLTDGLIEIYSVLNIPPAPDGSVELAETRFFHWLQVDPSSSNWFWTEIHTNQNSHGYPSLSTVNKQGTMAHEFGHSFGLAHLTSTQLSEVKSKGIQVIMLQIAQGRTTYLPQTDDCTGINSLYP
ncbi:peptidase M10 [Mahella australiensis]|uniref:Peptidase M10A and M12B matrixin and adamalysin n=1 Tax=Mahella australiensis (strain DSM 15567 / CIP 107919 / 50-1 BON) TaxID=697281 RepID=F3ZZB0_MAHA5|nr:peptidase M10 [Mahella australiensis]AEE95720.1 peptidase M10A and M12B matrixin and adamalysin [Mahella australiensis 50-1 BON]